MRRTTFTMVALLLIVGLSEAAADFNGNTRGAVTRTFGATVLAEVRFEGSGTGLHSPGSPCPTTVFGVRALVPQGFYYQSARVATNLEVAALYMDGAEEIPLLQPCPVPGSSSAPVSLVAPDFVASFLSDGLVADHLLCTQATVECFPDPGNSTAVLFACPATAALFSSPAADDGKSVLPGLNGEALSRSLSCAGGQASIQNPTEYYNDGGLGECESWFFSAGAWGTSFCVIPAADLVPYANDADETGYVVTCLTANRALVVDHGTIPDTTTYEDFQSHDYILVLDADGTPASWQHALQRHANPLGPATGTPVLQGVHDLGGKNPCPPAPAPRPPPAKEPSFCIVERTIVNNNDRIDPQCGARRNCTTAGAGSQVVTVTCTIENGCVSRRGYAGAELRVGPAASEVKATLTCVGETTRTIGPARSEAPPTVPPDRKEVSNIKVPGRYECQVVFDAGPGYPNNGYEAGGGCRDELARPVAPPP